MYVVLWCGPADTGNHRIRAIRDGKVSTVAGPTVVCVNVCERRD
jgi:hypothetical protein